MGKWADYCIEAVRYGSSSCEITHVKIRRDTIDCLDYPETWTKEQVIEMIANRFKDIITVTKVDGNWQEGAKVHAVRIGRSYYIRTDANEIEEDNLGELPGF